MDSTEVITQSAKQLFIAGTGRVLDANKSYRLGVSANSFLNTQTLGISRIERVCAAAYNTYCTNDGSGLRYRTHLVRPFCFS